MMARCSDSECNNIHCNGDNKNCPASSSYDRIADLERQLTAATERAEKAEADAERIDWIAAQGDEFWSEILVDQPGDGDYYVSGMKSNGQGKTFRDAVDSARLQEQPK